MTDRELLEAAARAAGLYADGYRAQHRDGEGWLCVRPADEKCPFQSVWSPLTDDGDAFRLAMKLRLSITHHHDVSQPNPWLRVADAYGNWKHAGPPDEFNADPATSTRRAIVRAAAAIGGAP